ncbi:hypothetical protein Slin15195_G117820 [Septoria linicola]|uniref:Uncharacterized protein n=1 Tax=Septoria linicola TaxID=215465 RepID=A0A9Q9B3V7_9PEZI|nr:hypothetical protein Slin15195_G117820 [Septoria linicola]
MTRNLDTQGPFWDERQLLELDPHAAVSRGYVLRHHNPEIRWRYVGNGFYEACPGRPNAETENIQGVISTAVGNRELSFVTTLEHETLLDNLQPSNSTSDRNQLERLAALETTTRQVVRIRALDPDLTSFSPSEISFLHLIVAWQYSTQSALSLLSRFLENTIKDLRTRRPHGQLLLPRFHDLVREAQYQFPLLWDPEVEGMVVEQRGEFAAQRCALHLSAVREMENEGNIGGMAFNWEKVEKGLGEDWLRDVLRGRPGSGMIVDVD